MIAGFFDWLFMRRWGAEAPMFEHTENITRVLHQNTRGIGHAVQVALGEVRQAGAGHQVEALKGRVEVFAQAGKA